MLGGEGHRLAEAEAVNLQQPRLAGRALALVGDRDHRLSLDAQPIDKVLVEGRDANPRVDQEEGHVGDGDGVLGLVAHARLQGIGGRVFQACRVDGRKTQIANAGLALAAVAGEPGGIVDQG